MCILTLVYVNVYEYFICIHLCLYQAKYEFLLLFLSLILYNIDYSNPLPLLFSVTSYSKSKKPGSHHPYLLIQFQCICMTAPELLPQNPMGSNFTKYTAMLMYSYFCLLLYRLLISNFPLASSCSPTPFSVVISCTYNTVRFFCHSLHSLLVSLDFLNDVFLTCIY